VKKNPVNAIGQKTLPAVHRRTGERLCLACGSTPLPKARRRYCSDKCKQRLDFALYICTGLLQALRCRYAAFSYTSSVLILDVLPAGSEVISRFVWQRTSRSKVADELLQMVNHAGRKWYRRERETGSSWWASQHLLDEGLRKDIPLNRVVPVSKRTPQLNEAQNRALKLLKLTKEQILSENGTESLKSAYRRKAKKHHPDKGGARSRFVRINEAHAQLLNWAKNPKFSSRAALRNSWCYDAAKGRWAPPA
jgi:hypothetical protein